MHCTSFQHQEPYLKELRAESLRLSERSEGTCFGTSAVPSLSSSGCSFRNSALALTTILYASRICMMAHSMRSAGLCFADC